MKAGQWQRLKEIFQEAEALGPAERPAFLDTACEGDEELRGEVESLLESHAQAPGLFEDTMTSRFGDLIDMGLDGLSPGDAFPPYRLIERIGIGGMGTVWKAEHEERPGTAVAIKFIRHGQDSAHVLRRFGTEHRSLANLGHPNISRLLDGGITPDGRSFLVMEYIDGVPIGEYCDRMRLGINERLGLFKAVCEAVEHAHHNLVVHRDLKPDNILVTAEGVPKLLDFGISKILHTDAGDANITATGSAPMTPQYASPEQIRGEPVTTATDLYSLGVVLYELLTGHRPYTVSTRYRAEIERMIVESDPQRPSTAVRHARTDTGTDGHRVVYTPEDLSKARRTHPEALSRRLAGDLDTILLMAMHKEPERRYASARELAADIERHLQRRPVLARKDTVLYRVGKFVRRNRAGVIAFVLLNVVLLAGVAGIVWQSRLAEKERDYAVTEAQTLHQVINFMITVLGRQESESAEARAAALARLRREVERIDRELAEQPRVRAALLGAMGSSFTYLDSLDEAEELLYRSMEIRLRFYGNDHPETAESLHRLGVLHLKQAQATGAPETAREAETLLRQAYEMWGRHWGKRHLDVAQAGFDLARCLEAKGHTAEADELLKEALETRTAILGADHPQARAVRDLLQQVRADG